jgi:hypothetical protein
MVLWTAALFLSVEPLVGHMLEPLLYGHSTGLSPVAVVASATFWTWLWGPIGLILATPLTICLVVLGRHVDRLKFLDVMFGDQPALTPAELVYQRMLARDPVEAAEQAHKFLKEKPLLAYYDEILLPGLKLAQADAERGLLDDERTVRVRDAVAEIIDDLSDHEDTPEPAPEVDTGMIAQLVERQGIGARAEEADALSMSRIFGLDTKDVALVCLCYVENATSAQIRYAIRRLRRKAPEAYILVATLGEAGNTDGREALQGLRNADLVRSLRETIAHVLAVASDAREQDPEPDSNVPMRAAGSQRA